VPSIAIVIVLSAGITGVLGSQAEDFVVLEQQATQMLRADTEPFRCGDLKSGLVALRAAVLASNAAQRTEAVGVIDALLARCR
jgi:hypothetical protein